MDDLISRQAAINALIRKMRPHDNGDGTMTIYVMSERLVRETLNELPFAQPEPQWIPCSERLPKHSDYDDTFIVTMQCEHVDGWPDYAVCSADWTPHGWDTWGEPLGAIKVVA